jgi:hypothetical protein
MQMTGKEIKARIAQINERLRELMRLTLLEQIRFGVPLWGERAQLLKALDTGDYKDSGYALAPCNDFPGLRPGDLVVLTAYRPPLGENVDPTHSYLTEQNWLDRAKDPDQQFMVITRVREADPSFGGGEFPTPPLIHYFPIDSVEKLQIALAQAVERNKGRFDRIIIMSHGGGGALATLGPSIRFKKGGERLNVKSLDVATIIAIRSALKPNGVFYIGTCGYRDVDDQTREAWGNRLEDWATLLQRKVSANPRRSVEDMRVGSVDWRSEGSSRESRLPNGSDPLMRLGPSLGIPDWMMEYLTK